MEWPGLGLHTQSLSVCAILRGLKETQLLLEQLHCYSQTRRLKVQSFLPTKPQADPMSSNRDTDFHAQVYARSASAASCALKSFVSSLPLQFVNPPSPTQKAEVPPFNSWCSEMASLGLNTTFSQQHYMQTTKPALFEHESLSFTSGWEHTILIPFALCPPYLY